MHDLIPLFRGYWWLMFPTFWVVYGIVRLALRAKRFASMRAPRSCFRFSTKTVVRAPICSASSPGSRPARASGAMPAPLSRS